MAGFFLLTMCFLCVSGVFGDEVKTVMEGKSVSLNSDVTKQPHEPMRWYFNDTRIAFIREDPSKSCLYDGEGGIFRDRLEVNYETGSLNITNITSEHAGRYELQFIRRDGTGTSSSLNRNRTNKCDRTKIISKPFSDDKDIIKSFRLIVTEPDKTSNDFNKNGKDGESDTNSGSSAGVRAGVVVVVVLLVFVVAVVVVAVVGVIYSRHRISRKECEKQPRASAGNTNITHYYSLHADIVTVSS